MSDNFDNLTVFARLGDNGEVVEYPVFALHIRNRAQPFEWYTQVEFAPRPAVPAFHNLKEIVTPSRDLAGVYHVKVTYEVVADTLAQVLSTLRKPAASDDIMGIPSNEPLAISDVPQETVLYVAKLATAMAQERLDTFAYSDGRNYGSINSAVSYRGSAVEKFDKEGVRAFELRDNTWLALYAYLEKVTTGQLPVPLTVAEIAAVLPELSWE